MCYHYLTRNLKSPLYSALQRVVFNSVIPKCSVHYFQFFKLSVQLCSLIACRDGNWCTNRSNLRAPFISPWMRAVCFRKALSRQISRYAKLIWSTVPSGWLWASEFQDREALRLTYILKPCSALNTFIQPLHHFTDVFHPYATINMFRLGSYAWGPFAKC